jgi:hypothetical protein
MSGVCSRRYKFDHLAGYANLRLTTTATLQTLVNARLGVQFGGGGNSRLLRLLDES